MRDLLKVQSVAVTLTSLVCDDITVVYLSKDISQNPFQTRQIGVTFMRLVWKCIITSKNKCDTGGGQTRYLEVDPQSSNLLLVTCRVN